MLKLYYSKGSSALAAHILLEEVGVAYEVEEISIPKGEHLTPAFLALNPKGRIPLLKTPNGMLTENPAILEYIAAVHPEAGLLPSGAFEQATARSLCAYLGATLHVAFAHRQRGARWADDPQAIEALRLKVPENLTEGAAYLENHVLKGPWALGKDYSFCDPYLFLLGRWMAANDLSLEPFPKLFAHQAAMRARPATRAVLQDHGLT